MSTPSITQSVQQQVAAKVQSKFKSAPVDDASFPEYFHGLIYGYTNSYKTTTAAMFGGPERTLIISTRDPEQIRIPLRGLGFKPIVLAHEFDSFEAALLFPDKAADAVGFPEWKDREDRVLMVDDWTEGASILVDDNQTNDDGKEIKDGRKIYGEVKKDVRSVLNALKRRRMHLVFTALAAENDWNLWPDMPKGARTHIESAFDYVFYMDAETKKMKTQSFSVPYVTKDQFGKDTTRLRKGFAKAKVPFNMRDQKIIGGEEPMNLAEFWKKICNARAK